MHRKIKWLTGTSLLAILLLLALQGYWVKKYYSQSSALFHRQVNLIFEDALKKEFGLRADTIEQAIKAKLIDTNSFRISSNYREDLKKMVYTVKSMENVTDTFRTSFSLQSYDVKIGDDSTRIFIASQLARLLRNEDIENHVIYYRTQTLGNFMADLTKTIQFDTTRLRPVMNSLLADKNIQVPYRFLTRKTDSTVHHSNFPDSLLRQYPVITRSLPTYSDLPGQQYVRVMFNNPFYHLITNMGLLLGSAVMLALLMAICFYTLLRSLHREKKLGDMKNDFISNITHEFKTPLATAKVAIEAIQEDPAIDRSEKAKRYLGHAHNEIDTLNELTDKILKLAVYEREEQILRKEKVRVMPLIEEIVETHQFNREAIHITVVNEADTEWLTVDETQFRHALSNVMDNALKYGSTEISIKLSILHKKGKMLLITVRDFGRGIPTASIPFIFDKFYRANEQKVKGHGLGLHYVQQILKLHEGWCRIENVDPGLSVQLAWPL